jgi:hypothetical protein
MTWWRVWAIWQWFGHGPSQLANAVLYNFAVDGTAASLWDPHWYRGGEADDSTAGRKLRGKKPVVASMVDTSWAWRASSETVGSSSVAAGRG